MSGWGCWQRMETLQPNYYKNLIFSVVASLRWFFSWWIRLSFRPGRVLSDEGNGLSWWMGWIRPFDWGHLGRQSICWVMLHTKRFWLPFKGLCQWTYSFFFSRTPLTYSKYCKRWAWFFVRWKVDSLTWAFAGVFKVCQWDRGWPESMGPLAMCWLAWRWLISWYLKITLLQVSSFSKVKVWQYYKVQAFITKSLSN